MVALAPLDAKEREALSGCSASWVEMVNPIILTRFWFHCAAAFPYAVADT
jgi:hypothetical protein